MSQLGIVTPSPYTPITLVLKSLQQKVFRKQHCMECGYPFAEINDKVLIGFDAETNPVEYAPDVIGLIEIQCPRRICRQHYRYELAK